MTWLNPKLIFSSLALLPLSLTALGLLGTGAIAETLRTENFNVEIERHCPEGTVVCNTVSYQGTNINSGASIRLTGRTVHTLCADGITPCRFIGYEFRNGDYRYVVTQDGNLRVSRNHTLLLEEAGTWSY